MALWKIGKVESRRGGLKPKLGKFFSLGGGLWLSSVHALEGIGCGDEIWTDHLFNVETQTFPDAPREGQGIYKKKQDSFITAPGPQRKELGNAFFHPGFAKKFGLTVWLEGEREVYRERERLTNRFT